MLYFKVVLIVAALLAFEPPIAGQTPGKAGAEAKPPEHLAMGTTSGPELESVTSRGDTRRLQRALKKEGFDPGPIDGFVGPRTREAVRRFQEANQLSVTGRLDRPTVDLLDKRLAANAPSPPQNLRIVDVTTE